MGDLDHTTATCADGPALMAWLDARCGSLLHDVAGRRRLQRWRAGGQASLTCVEDTLLRLGLDLSEVPTHIWRHYDNGRTGYRGRRDAA
jgi:hypothetical protein